MSEKLTMTLNLSEREMQVVEELAAKHDLTKTAVIRQALRLYQYVDRRLENGGRLSFSDDPPRLVEFVGIGWPDDAGRAALEQAEQKL